MRKLILVLLLLPLLALSAAANGQPEIVETDELLSELPQQAQAYLGDLGDAQEFSGTLREILSGAFVEARTAVGGAAALAGGALAIVLLCAVMDTMSHGAQFDAVTLVGALGIACLCAVSVRSMVSVAAETIQTISDYSAFLLPALSAATVAAGGVRAGPAIYAATLLGTQLLLRLMTKLLLPLVSLFLALATAQAAMEHPLLEKLKELIGSVISGCLKVVLTLFTGYLSVTHLVTGAADAAKIKAMKLAVGGAVPVVGSILSDASETVLVSAGILRNSIGVFGMLAILAVCCAPFLRIGAQYLILKLTAALSGTVGKKQHTTLLSDLATALGYLLAMMGVFSLLLLVCVVCFLRSVSG